jgi:hypothetical protein
VVYPWVGLGPGVGVRPAFAVAAGAGNRSMTPRRGRDEAVSSLVLETVEEVDTKIAPKSSDHGWRMDSERYG